MAHDAHSIASLIVVPLVRVRIGFRVERKRRVDINLMRKQLNVEELSFVQNTMFMTVLLSSVR